ncbi:MAG: hypothetical protein IJ111_01300 [Eggerthellaceae bacterium]|nr:hypothetical protein [Eggerthellaceae bacterium]
MSYQDLRKKYEINSEEDKVFRAILRKRAFDDLDAEIEAYVLNEKAEWNDGKKLEPTDEEVELILDDYLDRRYSDYAVQDEMEDMRDAIQSVTGLVC